MRAIVGAALVAIALTGCGSDSDPVAGPTDAASSTDTPSATPTAGSTPSVTDGMIQVADLAALLDQQVARRMGINGTIECGKETTWAVPTRKQCLLTGSEVQARINVTVAEDGSFKWRML